MDVLGAAVFAFASWAVGAVYGAFLWERAHEDRPLAEIVSEVGR